MNSIYPSGLYGSDGWYIPSNSHYTKRVNDSDYLWDDLIGTIVRHNDLRVYLLVKPERLVGQYMFNEAIDLQGKYMHRI